MRFKEITEIRKSYNRSVQVDPSWTVADIFNHVKKDIELALIQYRAGTAIYRGSPKPVDAYIVDPTIEERISANTTNYTNMLVSNLPEWADYPKRNRSLICSLDYNTANAYDFKDDPFIVLPFGNPTIGVCSSSDFWNSFKSIDPPQLNRMLEEIVPHYSQDFSMFVKKLAEYDSEIGSAVLRHLNGVKLPDTEMKNIQSKLDDRAFLNKVLRLYNLRSYLRETTSTNTPTIELLARQLDPDYNDFYIEDLANFESVASNNAQSEVWLSAKSLLIRKSALDTLL